jgi:cytochrome c-type biogenesis protein CcmH/NrfG
VAALQRSVALAPEDSSAWFQLGRAFQKSGRQSEARQAFARAETLNAAERAKLQNKVSGKGGR